MKNLHSQSLVNNEPLRDGQTLFNLYAQKYQGEIWFDSLVGTDADPFYNDNNIPKFLTIIKEHEQDKRAN